jgi:hypothetical protein
LTASSLHTTNVSNTSLTSSALSSHPSILQHIAQCKQDIPSKLGRLGDILSVSSGLDEAGALPFDGEGVEREELAMGLEKELEVEEL